MVVNKKALSQSCDIKAAAWGSTGFLWQIASYKGEDEKAHLTEGLTFSHCHTGLTSSPPRPPFYSPRLNLQTHPQPTQKAQESFFLLLQKRYWNIISSNEVFLKYLLLW